MRYGRALYMLFAYAVRCAPDVKVEILVLRYGMFHVCTGDTTASILFP